MARKINTLIFPFFLILLFSFTKIHQVKSQTSPGEIKASVTSDYCKIISDPSKCNCGNDDGLTADARRRTCKNENAAEGLPSTITAFTIPETIRSYPKDLTQHDFEYAGTALETDYTTSDSPCAIINYIERIDQDNYNISISLSLNGKGCNTTIPWLVSPREIGVKVEGRNALESCSSDSDDRQCDIMRTASSTGVNSGLRVVFDPPVYRFPLSQSSGSQKDRSVPFGYAGYYTYDKKTPGSCSKYGFNYMKRGSAGVHRNVGPIGTALFFPENDYCQGQKPSEGAFVSNYTARIISDRLATLIRAPKSITNRYMRDGVSRLFFDSNQIFNGDASSSTTSNPYGYSSLVDLLGIQTPFFCGENNRTREVIDRNGTNIFAPENFQFSIGGDINQVHSCPMSVAEWDAILPDLVLPGVNVDPDTVRPDISSTANLLYDQIEQAGKWHIPRDALNNMPVGIYRCSQSQNTDYASPKRAASYSSRHIPIVMTHGPNCMPMEALDPEELLRTGVGGYVGVLDPEEPNDLNEWLFSSGLPPRYAKALGETKRSSDGLDGPGNVLNPGSSNLEMLIYKGVSASHDTLNFDPNILKFFLCNGGKAFPMAYGMNVSSSEQFGPLVSNETTFRSEGPLWANNFRFASPEGLNGECTGCTFPTLSSQKGWTVTSTQMWTDSKGSECGKYHMDQSLWSRILSLVNSTQGFDRESETGPGGNRNFVDSEKYKIFALWNASTSLSDSFDSVAKALSQEKGGGISSDDLFLPEILNEFGIDGIGIKKWISDAADNVAHGCRPMPNFNSNTQTYGTSAIPFCSLFKQQYYQQMFARLSGNGTYTEGGNGFNSSVPDLDSAQSAGVFNRVSPNIWFGLWNLPENQGGPRWYAFFDDSWDRPITTEQGQMGIPNAGEGIAKDVKINMTITVPRSVMLQSNHITEVLSELNVNRETCSSDLISAWYYNDVSDVNNVKAFQTYQTEMSFITNSVGVQQLELYFVSENCESSSLTYDDSSYDLNTIPISSGSLISVEQVFNDDTNLNELKVLMKYDTVSVNVTYNFSFNFSCIQKQDPSKGIGFSVSSSYYQLLPDESNGGVGTVLTKVDLKSRNEQLCEKTFENVVDNRQYYKAYMFNNIKVPKNLPAESMCAVFFLDETDDNVGPLQYNVSTLSESSPGYTPHPDWIYPESGNRDIAYISSEANSLVQWRCISYSRKMDEPDFKLCNVSGAPGNSREGECLDIRDYLGQCNDWWDLSCTPYTSEQLTFLFSMAIGVPLISVTLFSFLLYAIRVKQYNRRKEVSGNDENEKNKKIKN